MLYQSFLCSFIAVPLLVLVSCMVSILPLTISLLGQIMSLLWQLLGCARWGGGEGGSPQIRVRTSRVDYVKRVNAHEAGRDVLARLISIAKTTQQQQRLGQQKRRKNNSQLINEDEEERKTVLGNWKANRILYFSLSLLFGFVYWYCRHFLLLLPCCCTLVVVTLLL